MTYILKRIYAMQTGENIRSICTGWANIVLRIPYQHPRSLSSNSMPGPYPGTTEISYVQPSSQWQSLYPTPVTSSISSQRNYTRGHPPSRSRSLPCSLRPSPGSPISPLWNSAVQRGYLCGSWPLLRADIPSSIHSSSFETSPRMVHPPSAFGNNGMSPNSPILYRGVDWLLPPYWLSPPKFTHALVCPSQLHPKYSICHPIPWTTLLCRYRSSVRPLLQARSNFVSH